MTPGEAAVRNPSVAWTEASAALRFSASVSAARASRTVIGPLQAGRPAPGSPGIAEDALGQLGEVHEVPVLERLARAAEPGQAILDVGGVARLAELAVVDHVHAGVRLLPHDLGHRGPDAGGERGAVDRHPFLPGEHRPHQVVGPRQAAGVRGEEPFAALSHAKHLSAAGTGVSGAETFPERETRGPGPPRRRSTAGRMDDHRVAPGDFDTAARLPRKALPPRAVAGIESCRTCRSQTAASPQAEGRLTGRRREARRPSQGRLAMTLSPRVLGTLAIVLLARGWPCPSPAWPPRPGRRSASAARSPSRARWRRPRSCTRSRARSTSTS